MPPPPQDFINFCVTSSSEKLDINCTRMCGNIAHHYIHIVIPGDFTYGGSHNRLESPMRQLRGSSALGP